MISKYRFSLPRLDITGMWVFSLGVWFHIVARLVYSKPWMAFFLAELIAAILVLFGAYQVLDAWIARVSLEEREALEARQQALMEGQQECSLHNRQQTHQPEQKSRLPAGSASATAGRLTWPTGRWCCLCRGIALTVTSLTRY